MGKCTGTTGTEGDCPFVAWPPPSGPLTSCLTFSKSLSTSGPQVLAMSSMVAEPPTNQGWEASLLGGCVVGCDSDQRQAALAFCAQNLGVLNGLL